MLNTLVWYKLFLGIIIFLLLYKLYTVLRQYRWKLLALIGIEKLVPDENNKIAADGRNDSLIVINPPIQSFQSPINFSLTLESFSDELKTLLKGSAASVNKEVLLESLKHLFSKYPTLKKDLYHEEIVASAFQQIDRLFPQLIRRSEILSIWT